MKRRFLGLLALAVAACGSSNTNDIKTPDQIIAEQEALGDQQLKNQRNADDYADTTGPTEDEKSRQWDDKQATLEMQRAVRSAETCPDSVTEKSPKGTASATILFQNDGHVKTATLNSPYDSNAVGKCVERALTSVIVPAFQGPEHTLEWNVDLTGAHKSAPAGDTAKDDSSK
jgi:hypothetical protein